MGWQESHAVQHEELQTTTGTIMSWETPSWKTAWMKRTWTPSWTRAGNVHFPQRRQSAGTRSKEVILPLYSALLKVPHKYSVLGSPVRKRCGVIEESPTQSGTTKMIKEPDHLSYKERWRELGLFSLEKRRLRGHLVIIYKDLKRGWNEDRARLFTVVSSDSTRDNGHRLENKRFCLNMRKHFFTVHWKTEYWQKFPDRLWVSVLGAIQKSPGHGPGEAAPGGLAWAEGLNQMTSGDPSKFNHSVILWGNMKKSRKYMQLYIQCLTN